MSLNLTLPSDWYATLLPQQRAAADWIIERIKDEGGVALFAQQRTGKTYITCAVIQRLKLMRILIIAPRTAIDAIWRPALATLGIPLRRPQELTGAPAFVAGVSYQEASKMPPRHVQRLLGSIQLVVVDESQGLKARGTGQSRMARRFRHAQRRLALSGTPIDDSPIDVWAQIRFVDHTILGENFTPFAERFCYKGGFMNRQWIFDMRKLPIFLHVLRNHIYRLTTDFMGIKPVQLHLVPTMLLGRQDDIYQCMSKHDMVTLDGAAITGSLPITKLAKLEQITGGAVLDENEIAHRVGFAKERKLRALLSRWESSTLEPVVIFVRYLHELRALKDMLNTRRRVGILYGGIKGKARVQLIDDFAQGRYDVLIAQLRTGSVSVSFARASTLVIYSMNHSYIDFEQLMARLQGLTQEKEVHAWLIYCENTVDEEKINRIKSKESTVYSVVSAFEKE